MFFMVLYQVSQGKILGKLNAKNKQCSTSEDYVSCDIDESESRKSRLNALIADLTEGQSREYGCNVTALFSGSTTGIVSWTIAIRHIPRKFDFSQSSSAIQMPLRSSR